MQISASTRFDWKDGLLVALGFTLMVLLLSFLRGTLDVDLGKVGERAVALPVVFGAVVARRVIFGPPRHGNMRTGILFRLLSIVGLLMLFFGLGAGAITMARFSHSSNPKPDFEAQERAIYAKPSEFDFVDTNELPDARERRQQADRDELESRIKRNTAEQQQQWAASDAEHKRLDWLFVLATVGLMAIGSFFLSLRYEKLAPESSAPNPIN
jgi:hypothetical protein